MMEEEDRIKEQKRLEVEQRAKAREVLRAKRVSEKESRKQCSAVFKSGQRKEQQCTTVCLVNADGMFYCKCHSTCTLQLLICCLFTFCNLDGRTCLWMRIWTKLLRVHIVMIALKCNALHIEYMVLPS